jgi:hypothetical protein
MCINSYYYRYDIILYDCCSSCYLCFFHRYLRAGNYQSSRLVDIIFHIPSDKLCILLPLECSIQEL